MEDEQGVGVPDERDGDELCAWVRLRPGAALDEESVRRLGLEAANAMRTA